MAYLLSQPAESLLDSEESPHVGTLIVGSGYGAAMAAFCLSNDDSGVDPSEIWVMERGKEYQPGEFPKVAAELPGHLMGTGTGVRFGERDALFDLKMGDGVSALVGNGLGGTSLINGGVAIDPSREALDRWPRRPDGRSWQQALKPSLSTVKRLLGVTTGNGRSNTHPAAEKLGKYRAMEGVAQGMKRAMQHTDRIEAVHGPEPIPLAITFEDGPNAVGINQRACIDCGNCITGCNIGAKNTLAMNVWPLVRSRGVKLFTGAAVQTLHRAEDHWVVKLVLTRHAGDLEHDAAPCPVFSIRASRVILAAGTFGSTEILQRSRDELELSDRLGQRFSVNGDMMVLGLRRHERVDGAAVVPSTAANTTESNVGPLTTSEIRARIRSEDGRSHEVSIQDGAVPFPMRRMFGELLATQHLARLFVDGRSPEQLPSDVDPVAVDASLVDHSQLITAMGWEASSGSLEMRTLRHAPELPGERVLAPRWDTTAEKGHTSYFDDLEMLLEQAERHGGFDGGHLLPCPPWRMVPKGLEVLEGFDQVERHLVTTHPLGGCCMGAEASEGVVDTTGRVFSGTSGTGTHPDLFVMDGAIIPGPVGVNPLMTIATLAHQLASDIAGDAATCAQQLRWNARRSSIPSAEGFPVENPQDQTVEGTLHERLFLDHPEPGSPGETTARRLRDRLGLRRHERLVVDIETHCEDLYRWLAKPDQPLPATFRFACSRSEGDTVPDDDVRALSNTAFQGWVTLGGRLAPGPLVHFWRRLRAIAHFYRMRGDEIHRRIWDVLRGAAGGQDAGRFLRVTWQQAGVQARWRYLRYRVEFEIEGAGEKIQLLGQKTLAYAGGNLDPLNALRKLPFSIDGSLPKPRSAPYLRLDMIRFTRDLAPLQVRRSPDSPTTIMAMASAAMFFLRSILQTHFWSFGAPGYAEYDDKAGENVARSVPPPARLAYGRENTLCEAALSEVAVPPRAGMRLVRYTPQHEQHPSAVLLIHGLGHGSRVFWTDTTPVNLVQHLLGQGYEVFLLDHRLSCNLSEDPDSSLSMEDIADVDIPWAVRAVYDTINAGREDGPPRGVKVFAHCIGAGAFAISTLSGHLRRPDDPRRTMIDSVVIHAVTPWLVASEDNRWRANAISMFRSYFDDVAYDPIPHRKPGLAETLADRFASSFGWPEGEIELHRSQHGERKAHYSRTICNRMTLFYGDEWIHENLDHRTHLNLHTMVGPAPIEVLRQVYYCIVRGRLTNREGTNEYVREQPLKENWTFPTLFLHGSLNKVFNPDGSRASASELRRVLGLGAMNSQVSLRIIKGYGHMDMLFGKRAHELVFPSIAGFLAGHELPAAHADGLDSRKEPRERVAPPLAPATGPIVSQPRAENGRHLVTLWSEVSRFTTQAAEVEYRCNGRLLDRQPVAVPAQAVADSTNGSARLPAADVRLCTLDVTDLDGPVSVALRYPGGPELEPEPVEQLEWRTLPWFQRTFRGRPTHEGVSFLVGSCLYPGSPAEQMLSDKVFERMRPFVRGDGAPGVDHLLLVGDQIYADATANLFDPASPLERFRERYRRAFGGASRQQGRHAHWVLSHLPTYFAVDDHEISDDWPRDKLRRRHPRGERFAPDRELAFARGEAISFMMHCTSGAHRLWYTFESAGHPFFVFDTRTERLLGPRTDVTTLISTEQQDAFSCWLDHNAGSSQVIIVTGSPLGPISKAQEGYPVLCDRSDTVLGYPGFLCWLHDQLEQRSIGELVWISGDAHFSCRGTYRLQVDNREIPVQHIVASGLYAPLPFANHAWAGFRDRVTFARNVRIGHTTRRLEIRGEQRLLCDSKAHFVHVTIHNGQLSAAACSAAGAYPTQTADSLTSQMN